MPSPDPEMRTIPLTLVREGERVMRICNACRYCEGFCAVFPAMERRLSFSEPDLVWLANLCHDCGECLYSCQYAPPHPFDVRLPQVLAEIRRASYRKYAWPGALGVVSARPGVALAVAALVAPLVFLVAAGALVGRSVLFSAHSDAEGAFYRVVPHATMISIFGSAGLFVLAALAAGVAKFWRDIGEPLHAFTNWRALGQATSEALTLRYLDGGGDGCTYPADVPSGARRWFHHLTFYGFLLCFAATSVAAAYHNVLGWKAPYPVLSVPVILGSFGGAGLLVGPVGLLWLKAIRRAEREDRGQSGMDIAFLVMLFLTSVTGFLVLLLRESSAMGTLLAVHLGIVLGLFLTLPYGKFVHGIYRFAALVRNALELRRAVDGQYPRF